MDQNHSSNFDFDAAMPTTCPDFGLHDFITESNFDQFLEMIVGEEIITAAEQPVVLDFGTVGQGLDLMIGDDEVIDRLLGVEIESQFHEPAGLVMDPLLIDAVDDLFAFGQVDDINNNNVVVSCVDDELQQLMDCSLLGIDVLGVGEGHVRREDEDEDDDDDEDGDDNFNDGSVSSGTTNTSKKGKSDRSRTLISERRRRVRMKDNLYALRALVPNITKMDKASIVGDAVLYVQNLQVKAKMLKTEIADIEASVARQGLNGKTCNNNSHLSPSNNNIFTTVHRCIKQMDVFQVGEGEFYIKMKSNKGEGIAACLHKAIESFNGGFKIQSTNLSTVLDNYVLTFTLHVRDGGGEMNLSNLKLWLSKSLSSQGFSFQSSP
ncbi:unnamed protein product [Rhodiola kirilowii]